MYEKGEVVIDKISPKDRFGDLIDNDTLLYSMSLGKSVGSYLMGHAICNGYVDSIDHQLSDWPIVANSLIAEASVRDVINASMGHQKYMENNEIFKETGTNVNRYPIETLVRLELPGSTPSKKRFEYGQLPAKPGINSSHLWMRSFATMWGYSIPLDSLRPSSAMSFLKALSVQISSPPVMILCA
jgi:hypothetical protein